jgi:hypothetical protein
MKHHFLHFEMENSDIEKFVGMLTDWQVGNAMFAMERQADWALVYLCHSDIRDEENFDRNNLKTLMQDDECRDIIVANINTPVQFVYPNYMTRAKRLQLISFGMDR